MRNVYYGLVCLRVGISIYCAIALGGALTALASCAFSSSAMLGSFSTGMAAAMGLGLLAGFLQLVALGLFCFAPAESGGKPLALGAGGLGLLALLLQFLGGTLGFFIAGLAGLGAQICLILFLRAFAVSAGRQDLADLFSGVFTMGCLSAVMLLGGPVTSWYLGVVGMVVSGLAVIPMLLTLLRYARAVSGLVQATKEYV